MRGPPQNDDEAPRKRWLGNFPKIGVPVVVMIFLGLPDALRGWGKLCNSVFDRQGSESVQQESADASPSQADDSSQVDDSQPSEDAVSEAVEGLVWKRDIDQQDDVSTIRDQQHIPLWQVEVRRCLWRTPQRWEDLFEEWSPEAATE